MMYIYCYDIAEPKRWRKIAKELEQMGLRVQKSIFQCEASKTAHAGLIRTLRSYMDRKKDSLRVYPICEDCAAGIEYDGHQPIIEVAEFRII